MVRRIYEAQGNRRWRNKMTPDERLKLGRPVMMLIGYCGGSAALPADCQGWAGKLRELAAELVIAWEEVTDSKDANP
jgi:hypothetical protein